ncbi:MAG: hypothetical protein J6N51_15590 [Selenomonas sp.]|nr:hypothetical protein [Selenomonas sp.]
MGKVIDMKAWGKESLKPAEKLAMMVMAGDKSAIEYAQRLNENADGLVSLAVFINRCQRSLDLARKARAMFSEDIRIGGRISEAFDHVVNAQAMLTPTVIESRLFSSFKLVSNFREIGRYSKKNPEIQFLYDMKNCPKLDGDVTYYARQVDYAIGRMYADGRFSEEEIIDTAMRCSPLNDSTETLMLPIMLLRDELMKQDRDFVVERVAEGIDVETAIEICKKQMQHRPGDAEYYDEIREHVRRKESELA